MQPKCGMWTIQGTVTIKTENGSVSPQFATFYLHPEVQGCSTKESAERVAASILNPANDPNIQPNPYAVLNTVASVAEWSDEEVEAMKNS